VQVQEDLVGFAERDTDIVAVGQGTGAEAAGYMEKWGVDLRCFGDTTAAAYQSFGLTRGSPWSVMFRGMVTQPLEALQAIARADLSGALLASSDVMRLGGVAIVAIGGELREIHRAEDPTDIPTNAEVFARLDLLRVGEN
jgi:hypothetical protein